MEDWDAPRLLDELYQSIHQRIGEVEEEESQAKKQHERNLETAKRLKEAQQALETRERAFESRHSTLEARKTLEARIRALEIRNGELEKENGELKTAVQAERAEFTNRKQQLDAQEAQLRHFEGLLKEALQQHAQMESFLNQKLDALEVEKEQRAGSAKQAAPSSAQQVDNQPQPTAADERPADEALQSTQLTGKAECCKTELPESDVAGLRTAEVVVDLSDSDSKAKQNGWDRMSDSGATSGGSTPVPGSPILEDISMSREAGNTAGGSEATAQEPNGDLQGTSAAQYTEPKDMGPTRDTDANRKVDFLSEGGKKEVKPASQSAEPLPKSEKKKERRGAKKKKKKAKDATPVRQKPMKQSEEKDQRPKGYWKHRYEAEHRRAAAASRRPPLDASPSREMEPRVTRKTSKLEQIFSNQRRDPRNDVSKRDERDMARLQAAVKLAKAKFSKPEEPKADA